MKIKNTLALAMATGVTVFSSYSLAQTTVTIGTVNNGDMIIMQRLSSEFEKSHPDIRLNWVILEENVLRQRLTTDISTKGGQFDVMTIGMYEAPLWGALGWLDQIDNLPASYDLEDVMPSVRDGLSWKGTLFALPFYGESSMTFYNKDLFKKAGLTMPEQPTWAQIEDFASKTNDPQNGTYGVCLRGKPGWGENMTFLSTLVNTYGGSWFDMGWKPQVASEPWQKAIGFYVDLMKKYGPPGASSNGFNENQALFSSGKCAIWVDSTAAAGRLMNPKESQVVDSVGFAPAPVAVTPKGSAWLWSWALAIPSTSKVKDAAKEFITWATSKEYIQLVGQSEGWVAVPPGTRASTYTNQHYTDAAPFAALTLKAMQNANPLNPSLSPVPYTGVQFVGIPEFQSIGTQVGKFISGALTGQTSVDQALKSAESVTEREMKRSGYIK
ncbi:sugar ABC transporter substrate-binding protein [Pokkaliibacter plantistimulans]|uniref:Sugar ABC transporter substrate-binding protein n=1 Tax=Proteobacteria bacterium 228 TaxID=2083153 RepID=A0A2S5KW40_9PROT|nr:sugar ABC transporter substrate-binding protein [Pokkaliibacter plantistimulans]PPC78729.1 sugar ABC transporter substrate-binding protein [Pokkaliibacter plantistimulans]